MSSQQDVIYITKPQQRAWEKLGSEWVTAAKLSEYLCTMWALYEKGLVELKMTKYKVLWRRPEATFSHEYFIKEVEQ